MLRIVPDLVPPKTFLHHREHCVVRLSLFVWQESKTNWNVNWRRDLGRDDEGLSPQRWCYPECPITQVLLPRYPGDNLLSWKWFFFHLQTLCLPFQSVLGWEETRVGQFPVPSLLLDFWEWVLFSFCIADSGLLGTLVGNVRHVHTLCEAVTNLFINLINTAGWFLFNLLIHQRYCWLN